MATAPTDVAPGWLSAALDVQLRNEGSIRAPIDTLAVPVDTWRATVRAIGRGLRRPVQTRIVGGEVHAVLRDWPASEYEAVLRRQRDEAKSVAGRIHAKAVQDLEDALSAGVVLPERDEVVAKAVRDMERARAAMSDLIPALRTA